MHGNKILFHNVQQWTSYGWYSRIKIGWLIIAKLVKILELCILNISPTAGHRFSLCQWITELDNGLPLRFATIAFYFTFEIP